MPGGSSAAPHRPSTAPGAAGTGVLPLILQEAISSVEQEGSVGRVVRHDVGKFSNTVGRCASPVVRLMFLAFFWLTLPPANPLPDTRAQTPCTGVTRRPRLSGLLLYSNLADDILESQ